MTHRLTITRHDGTTVLKWLHGPKAGKEAQKTALNLEEEIRIHRVVIHRLTSTG